MNVRYLLPSFLLIAAPLLAQAPPAAAPAPEDFGFTYHTPESWDAIDAQSTLPEVKQQQAAKARTDDERREIACVQVPISARRPAPPSFLAVMALPFDCFGQIMTAKDLAGVCRGQFRRAKKLFRFRRSGVRVLCHGQPHLVDRARKRKSQGASRDAPTRSRSHAAC